MSYSFEHATSKRLCFEQMARFIKMQSLPFNRSHIRIGISDAYEPLFYECGLTSFVRTKYCKPGVLPEIMHLIMYRLKMSYEIVRFSGVQEYGSPIGNTSQYSGFLGFVQNGSVDIFARDFIPTQLRQETFDFSQSYALNEMLMVVPASPVESLLVQTTVLFKMYKLEVWAIFAVIFIIVTMTKIICNNLAQTVQLKSAKDFGSISALTIISLFSLLLFQNIYRGFLLTTLMTPDSLKKIKTFEQAMEHIAEGRLELQMLSPTNPWIEGAKTGKGKDSRLLIETINKHPIVPQTNITKTMIDVNASRAISFSTKFIVDTNRAGYCNVYTFVHSFEGVCTFMTLPMRKGFYLKAAIDSTITSEFGMFQEIFRQYMPRETCHVHQYLQKYQRALNIKDVAGIMVILFLGVTIAFTIFIFQRAFFQVKAFSKPRVSQTIDTNFVNM